MPPRQHDADKIHTSINYEIGIVWTLYWDVSVFSRSMRMRRILGESEEIESKKTEVLSIGRPGESIDRQHGIEYMGR
jgi:hypothetical protein